MVERSRSPHFVKLFIFGLTGDERDKPKVRRFDRPIFGGVSNTAFFGDGVLSTMSKTFFFWGVTGGVIFLVRGDVLATF